jgi:hypothetical protein
MNCDNLLYFEVGVENGEFSTADAKQELVIEWGDAHEVGGEDSGCA